MDVREQLLILRRSWRLITVLALLGTILAGVASLLTPTSYTASTSLFVSTQNSETSAELQQGSVFALARVQSYVDVTSKPTVLQPVIDKLNLGMTPEALAAKIKTSTARNTVIIEIEARDGSAQRSADIANAVAASLITAVADLSGRRTERRHRSGSARWITPPRRPSRRVPTRSWTLAWAFCTGSQPESRRPYCAMSWTATSGPKSDLRKMTDLPLLAGITEQTAGRLPGAAPSVLGGSGAEAFRKLRTNLQFAGVNRPMRSIVVTSASAGEGKSTVALNLAVTIAKGGQKVILVDADFVFLQLLQRLESRGESDSPLSLSERPASKTASSTGPTTGWRCWPRDRCRPIPVNCSVQQP